MSRQSSQLPQLLLFAFLALHASFFLMWLLGLWGAEAEQGDWYHLKVVGEHFVAGDRDHLYEAGEHAINPGYYWRYPPFALYLVAPLAWVSNPVAYGLMAGLGIGAVVAVLGLLVELAPPGEGRVEWTLAIVFSAPMLTMLVAGQNSALIALCVMGAAALWTRGRVLPACALLGLLALKPNWGAFFGLYALVRGEFRGAAVMLGVVAGLCVASLPLGTGLWVDFLASSASNEALIVDYEAYKLITLKGFLTGAFGRATWVTGLWGISCLGLLAATVLAWRQPLRPVRQLGLVLLLLVATNPYVSFYDALVLAIPASVWWSDRARWTPWAWWLVGALILVAWTWEQSGFAWISFLDDVGVDWVPPFSLVGPAVSLWLLIEAREAVLRPDGWH